MSESDEAFSVKAWEAAGVSAATPPAPATPPSGPPAAPPAPLVALDPSVAPAAAAALRAEAERVAGFRRALDRLVARQGPSAAACGLAGCLAAYHRRLLAAVATLDLLPPSQAAVRGAGATYRKAALVEVRTLVDELRELGNALRTGESS